MLLHKNSNKLFHIVKKETYKSTLFDINNKDLVDKSVLGNNCHTDLYRRVKFLFKLFMRFGSLKLTKDNEKLLNSSSIKQNNRLTFSNPFNSSNYDDDESKTIKSKLKRLSHKLYFIYVLYIFIKFSMIAIVQFKHDRLLLSLTSKIRKNVTVNIKSEQCAFSDDINYYSLLIAGNNNHDQHMVLFDTYISYRDFLLFLGDPMISLIGIGSVLSAIIPMLTLTYFLLPILYLYNKQIRLDSWSFVLEPISECQRIKNELSIIINELIGNLEERSNYIGRFDKYHLLMNNSSYEQQQKLNCFDTHAQIVNYFANDKHCIINNYSKECHHNFRKFKREKVLEPNNNKINYYQIFTNILISSSIKPANLTLEAHNKLLNVGRIFYIYHTLEGVMAMVFVIVFIIYKELNLRVLHRFKQIECQNYHIDLKPIRDLINLDKLTSLEDYNLYRNYNGTLNEIISLTLIEAKLYFKPKVILTLIELSSSLVVVTIWVVIYVSLFLQSHLGKFIWIKQIIRQLEYCIKQMLKCSVDESKHDKLIESITMVYVNFELFRRQQKAHQAFMNFLFLQVSITAAICVLQSYLINRIVTTPYVSILLLIATVLATLVNIYLISGSLFVGKFKTLIKSVIRLLVNSSIVSLQDNLMIELFRREIIDKKDILDYYTPNFFNIHVSYDKIVTINIYLITVWWVLLSE